MQQFQPEISRHDDGSLDEESRHLTPKCSPYRHYADSQHGTRFPSKIVSLQDEKIDNVWSGGYKPTNEMWQQHPSITQPASRQVQQSTLNRDLRPLLPKINEHESSSPLVSQSTTIRGSLHVTQPHDSANRQSQQTSLYTARNPNLLTAHPQYYMQPPSPEDGWPNLEENLSYSHSAPLKRNRWIQAGEYRRRVHEAPYHDTHSDPTLTKVQRDTEFWINQLVLAMTNLQDVKDTDNSHAKRMFKPGAYDSLLIESTSRQIYASLLDRCISGFRGPSQFNKALKPGKECEADRTASCEVRMQNVIQALTWNKRVCKDVLYEDWKIWLLVNHPLAYDKEKDNQKGSNDQRRAKQMSEREKLKQTEEELLKYRQGKHEEGHG